MRDGISSRPVTPAHEFSAIVNSLAADYEVSPLVVYAIRLNETSEGFPPDGLQAGADPKTGLMPDGSNAGHGIMQLTSSWPSDWAQPRGNIEYAIDNFIAGDWEEAVRDTGLQGEPLVRFIAAAYNAGYGVALRDHTRGDVDANTTDRYGERAAAHYRELLAESEAESIAEAKRPAPIGERFEAGRDVGTGAMTLKHTLPGPAQVSWSVEPPIPGRLGGS